MTSHTSTSTAASPSIRFRSRNGLRSLGAAQRTARPLIAAEGRHDRIVVDYTARVAATPLNFDDILSAMGPRDDVGLFIGTPRGTSDTMRLASRRDASRAPLWLVGGKGTATWRPQGPFIDVRMELHLNPTRWLAHQHDLSPVAMLASDPFDALRVDPTVRDTLSALTLDGGDNVLIGLERLGGERFEERGELWHAVLAIYVQHVANAVRATMASEGTGAVILSDRFQLRQAEAYWELHASDAVAAVSDLARAMAAADGSARVFRRVEAGGEVNATWCKLSLTDAITAKVYAKLADRVRVELEFSGRIDQVAYRMGQHSDEPVDKLLALRQDAANRLNTLWTAIMSLRAVETSTVDLCDFMACLNRTVPDENRRLVTSLLTSHRGLTATAENGFASPAVCRALAREGLLVRTPARQRAGARYALAPAYSAMLDRMLAA